MHYSEEIRKYNRGPSRICDIQILVQQRNANLAIICGSGPSLNSLLASDISSKGDLMGTSSIILASKKAKWIFWELAPIFGLEPEPTYGTLDFNCTDLIFNDRLRDCLLEREIESVLVNPFFPSKRIISTRGYLSPLPREILQNFPNYYFVNESNFVRMEQDLRRYSSIQNELILNFRCSVIRMISFAVALEYPRIIISGIDPSLPGYWYTDEKANYYSPMTEMMNEVLMNKKEMINGGLSGRKLHEGESYGDTINMCESVWYAMPYIIKWAKTNHRKVPFIEYWGNDLNTMNSIRSFCPNLVTIKRMD